MGGLALQSIHYTRGLFHGLPPNFIQNTKIIKTINGVKPPLRNTVNEYTMANPPYPI